MLRACLDRQWATKHLHTPELRNITNLNIRTPNASFIYHRSCRFKQITTLMISLNNSHMFMYEQINIFYNFNQDLEYLDTRTLISLSDQLLETLSVFFSISLHPNYTGFSSILIITRLCFFSSTFSITHIHFPFETWYFSLCFFLVFPFFSALDQLIVRLFRLHFFLCILIRHITVNRQILVFLVSCTVFYFWKNVDRTLCFLTNGNMSSHIARSSIPEIWHLFP